MDKNYFFQTILYEFQKMKRRIYLAFQDNLRLQNLQELHLEDEHNFLDSKIEFQKYLLGKVCEYDQRKLNLHPRFLQ